VGLAANPNDVLRRHCTARVEDRRLRAEPRFVHMCQGHVRCSSATAPQPARHSQSGKTGLRVLSPRLQQHGHRRRACGCAPHGRRPCRGHPCEAGFHVAHADSGLARRPDRAGTSGCSLTWLLVADFGCDARQPRGGRERRSRCRCPLPDLPSAKTPLRLEEMASAPVKGRVQGVHVTHLLPAAWST
jgi:hypothetical protein